MKPENQKLSATQQVMRIPAKFRIGVTGHRELRQNQAISASVREVLRQLDEWFGRKLKHTPHSYVVISPLAEGADRLVAREVLKWPSSHEAEEAQLEAVLPLPEEDYIQDFATQLSKKEFYDLFNAKNTGKKGPQKAKTREEAYKKAGQYVVDNCDVLIAVWDGEKVEGEERTANIVKYAKKIGRHIFWINSNNPKQIEEIKPQKKGKEYIVSLKILDKFNYTSISEIITERAGKEILSTLVAKIESSEIIQRFFRQVKNQILPWFARADLLAVKYQKLHNGVGLAIYWLSAFAVIVVAAQILFLPQSPEYIIIELGLIAGIFLLLVLCHTFKWHRKWIDYRFLAERLRAAIFLKAVGIQFTKLKPPPYLSPSHRPDDWMIMAFNWIWRRTNIQPIPYREKLMDLVRMGWIENQREYYNNRSKRLSRKHGIFSIVAYLLFSLIFIIGVVHYLQPFASDTEENIVTLAAIALPAIGGALHGIRAQRDYHRNAERYGAMEDYLKIGSEQIVQTDDEKTFADLIKDANEMMLLEHQDWRVVVLFHEIEVPG